MKLIKQLSFFFLYLTAMQAIAQNCTGIWTGTITQEKKENTFFYQLNLQQDGNKITGTAHSRTNQTGIFASFQIGGIIENEVIILQEVLQLEPKDAKWCLKHLRLKISRQKPNAILSGTWTAEGCTPGTVMLQKNAHTVVQKEVELSEAIKGNWVGQLSQTDREYGFYFELNLADGKTGQSKIVSEDNGGICEHGLNWELIHDNLIFQEQNIIKKSDGNWPWCIKSANMVLRKDSLKYMLTGSWEGFIEGHTPETGACAPGSIYLEKPLIYETYATKKETTVYEVEEKRKVKIARIAEVKSNQLKIKVWDNGIVDGDILTLFLNGEKLLEKHRVTKTKRTVLVKLKEDINLLVLHAEDLGDIMPNTVAVSIDDGTKEQVLILSSNLRESGGVLIKQFSVAD